MGFELADWLVERGAKKLILVSRTGNYDRYHLRKISKWQSSGILIKISTDNIATLQGVENLLKGANQMGVVAAIFNTTLVLSSITIIFLKKIEFKSLTMFPPPDPSRWFIRKPNRNRFSISCQSQSNRYNSPR